MRRRARVLPAQPPGEPEAYCPVMVGELELGDVRALEASEGPSGPYRRARVLVRAHRQPLGFIESALNGRVAPAELVGLVEQQLGDALHAHLHEDGLAPGSLTVAGLPPVTNPRCTRPGPQGPSCPPVSVVVCTRDRVESLRATLLSLLAVEYSDFEVLVVDNAPRTSATRDFVAQLGDARVRLITESRAGLSAARNRGVAESRHRIVAFTDDDVIVDAGWLGGLTRGFTRAANVACVTGMVPAAQLDTAAQAYFDAKVSWAQSLRPRLFDLADHRVDAPLYPYLPGTFGAGANFALSLDAFADVGPFDEALGAGSPAQGGEDLDYFLRCVLGGHAVAYEPSALVWHIHRREATALQTQMVGYGSGLSAVVFKCLIRPRTAVQVLLRVPSGLQRMLELHHGPGRPVDAPPGLRIAELSGLLRGPFRYVRGRMRVVASRG